MTLQPGMQKLPELSAYDQIILVSGNYLKSD